MTTKNSCKTAAVMGLLGKGPAAERVLPAQPAKRSPIEPAPLGFDGAGRHSGTDELSPKGKARDAELVPTRDIETITSEILEAQKTGGEAILTIGRGLIEAKSLLSHGEWLDWLENKVEIKVRGAQRLMQLAQTYSNASALTHLGQTKALMLAVLSEDDRNVFMSETHLVGGEEKAVIDMTSRELAAAIKERDEALKAVEQAKAGQTAAEQAREKMAADMAMANERVAGLNDLVERYSAEALERQETLAQVTAELEALKSRPVEVAVEADHAAVEAARKEAEAVMRAQVDQAEAAQKKARANLMELSSALQRAKLEREQAEVELRKQLAQAEKKAALASNEDLVLFNALFEQVQELVNKMGGVLLKVRPKDPEKARGLSKALLALSEKIQEEAGHE